MKNTEPDVIRVVLADDHPIVRSGIRGELARQQDIQVIAEAVNGDQALSLAQTLHPDVLLLDVRMPGLRTTDIVRISSADPKGPAVIVLSAYGDKAHVLALLAAGARGYILKDENPGVIAEAIHAVKRGVIWLSPSVAGAMGPTGELPVEATKLDTLSEREREVLRLMTRGLNNKMIAETLNVAEKTVKFHINNIDSKLAVTSRVEAVLYAIQMGLGDAE